MCELQLIKILFFWFILFQKLCPLRLPSYVLTASRFMACRIMWYSSEMPFPPSISLACLAISSAFPQLFLLSIEIISGAALLWHRICTFVKRDTAESWSRKLKKENLLFLINESSQSQTRLQAKGDLSQHVSHFLLHQLISGQWHTKLDSEWNGVA